MVLGLYLWQHLLNGSLSDQSEGWKYGQMNIDNIQFRYIDFFLISWFVELMVW